jgi:hypothetical protein
MRGGGADALGLERDAHGSRLDLTYLWQASSDKR